MLARSAGMKWPDHANGRCCATAGLPPVARRSHDPTVLEPG